MSRPLLTIAVPTYNRANLLDLCLGRIIDQLAPHADTVEVVISNNAATDHTKEIVAKYQQMWPALRYAENEKNGGPDYNIAKCFELATAKYVWVFSDDDLLLPESLNRIIPLLKEKELGIITLATSFYRHSIHEVVHPSEPLAYTLYSDPAKLAAETHFWLTYITGIITNKELVQHAATLYHYQNSFMIQLGWVIPALFSGKPSARVTTPLILGRALEVLDFKLFHVFGTSYPRVLEGLAHQGVLPVPVKEMLIESIIKQYFPNYIQPDTHYAHNERPLLILGKSFWKRQSFWVALVPLFMRRQLFRGLNKVKRPLLTKVKQLLAKTYGRVATLHQTAQVESLIRQFKSFGSDSNLPFNCHISNPQFMTIGRNLQALPGLFIEAHNTRGGDNYTPTVEIGDYVRLGTNCRLDCCLGIYIGDWVLIGHRVVIADNELTTNHIAVLTHPPANRRVLIKGPIIISDNVLIEDDVRILSGVTIGRNAIIRAGAVVHDSVPANVVVAGNPAQVIYR